MAALDNHFFVYFLDLHIVQLSTVSLALYMKRFGYIKG